MREVKKRILSAIFVLSFPAMLILTGMCEQGDITTLQYAAFTAADLLLMVWSGFKSQLLKK